MRGLIFLGLFSLFISCAHHHNNPERVIASSPDFAEALSTQFAVLNGATSCATSSSNTHEEINWVLSCDGITEPGLVIEDKRNIDMLEQITQEMLFFKEHGFEQVGCFERTTRKVICTYQKTI